MLPLQPNQALNSEEAAAYLGISRKTLEYWRWERRGPAYHKVGRLVRYSRADLDAWLMGKRINPDD